MLHLNQGDANVRMLKNKQENVIEALSQPPQQENIQMASAIE